MVALGTHHTSHLTAQEGDSRRPLLIGACRRIIFLTRSLTELTAEAAPCAIVRCMQRTLAQGALPHDVRLDVSFFLSRFGPDGVGTLTPKPGAFPPVRGSFPPVSFLSSISFPLASNFQGLYRRPLVPLSCAHVLRLRRNREFLRVGWSPPAQPHTPTSHRGGLDGALMKRTAIRM